MRRLMPRRRTQARNGLAQQAARLMGQKEVELEIAQGGRIVLGRYRPPARKKDGELSDATCRDSWGGGGAELPRRSDVRVPVVHQSKVAYISGKAVPSLVSLWTDMVEQGRRFGLLAPHPVWAVQTREVR